MEGTRNDKLRRVLARLALAGCAAAIGFSSARCGGPVPSGKLAIEVSSTPWGAARLGWYVNDPYIPKAPGTTTTTTTITADPLTTTQPAR